MDREVYQKFNQSIYREQLSNGLKVQLLPMEGYHKTYAILTADFGSIDNHFIPYHQHSHLCKVHQCFRSDFVPYTTLPYPVFNTARASVRCLAPLHFLRKTTRPVSYYALFE